MIIKEKSLTRSFALIRGLNRVLLGAFLFLGTFFLFFVIVHKPAQGIYAEEEGRGGFPPPPSSQYDYTQLGGGALGIASEGQPFFLPDLSEEIVLLAENTRPDLPPFAAGLQLGLQGKKRARTLAPGQVAYLTYDKEQLDFSREETPFWIRASGERGKSSFQLGVRLLGDRGEVLVDQVRELPLRKGGIVLGEKEAGDPALQEGADLVRGGKWWSSDKLFQRYGGEEFEKYKGIERFIIEGDKGKQVLFIEEGKTFVWQEGAWHAARETNGLPMGKVIALTPHSVEWQLWDTEGWNSMTISIAKSLAPPSSLRMEDVFSELRRRTAARVSCRVSNRSTILTEGDWLVCTAKGWRVIKSYREVEALLGLEKEEDLFVFDGLKEMNGNEVFCGTLFNPMRTEQHFVQIPIARGKGGKHSSPQKKNLSTRIISLMGKGGAARQFRKGSSKKQKQAEDQTVGSE